MDKSPDAFRTISEVAEWLGVQTHVLRFWESKFSQVKPVKRAGGRRYYRPADMTLLGGIKALLHDEGMTIKGVQKLLREDGVAHVSSFSQPLDSDIESSAETNTIAAAENVLRFKARPEDRARAETGTSHVAEAEAAPEPATDPAPPPQAEASPPASVTPTTPTQESAPAATETPGTAPDEPAADAQPEPSPLPSFLTQPMGGAPKAEPPRPRIVDAPDPPPEAEIATQPRVLSHLANARRPLGPDQIRALTPLLGRLAVLRDRMADHHG